MVQNTAHRVITIKKSDEMAEKPQMINLIAQSTILKLIDLVMSPTNIPKIAKKIGDLDIGKEKNVLTVLDTDLTISAFELMKQKVNHPLQISIKLTL
jgi:hypothetical protein